MARTALGGHDGRRLSGSMWLSQCADGGDDMIPEPAAGIQAQALAALQRQASALASLSRRLDAAVGAWASAAELSSWQGPAGWCYSVAAGQLRSELWAASETLTLALRETRRAVRSLEF